MTIEDHIKHVAALQKKRFRRKVKLAIFFSILSVILIIGLRLIVEYNQYSGIPPKAASYLLNTIITSFSARELRAILIEERSSDNQLIPLLLIYYSYFFISLLLGFLPSLFIIGAVRRRQKTAFYENALISIYRIRDRLKDYMKNPNRIKRTKLISSINNSQLVLRQCEVEG